MGFDVADTQPARRPKAVTAVVLHEARVDTTKRSESTSARASPSDAALPQRPSYFLAHSAKM
jgi:hypothetical protein